MHARRVVTMFCVLVATALLALAPTAAAQTNPLLVLHINWFIPDPPTVVAHGDGSLRSVGLDAEYTTTTGSTPQMQGLSYGTYDRTYTAFDNVLAWAGRQGADIVAVALIDNAVDVPLYVRPEIKTWED